MHPNKDRVRAWELLTLARVQALRANLKGHDALMVNALLVVAGKRFDAGNYDGTREWALSSLARSAGRESNMYRKAFAL